MISEPHSDDIPAQLEELRRFREPRRRGPRRRSERPGRRQLKHAARTTRPFRSACGRAGQNSRQRLGQRWRAMIQANNFHGPRAPGFGVSCDRATWLARIVPVPLHFEQTRNSSSGGVDVCTRVNGNGIFPAPRQKSQSIRSASGVIGVSAQSANATYRTPGQRPGQRPTTRPALARPVNRSPTCQRPRAMMQAFANLGSCYRAPSRPFNSKPDHIVQGSVHSCLKRGEAKRGFNYPTRRHKRTLTHHRAPALRVALPESLGVIHHVLLTACRLAGGTLHHGDAGVPTQLDGRSIPSGRWRERAYPQLRLIRRRTYRALHGFADALLKHRASARCLAHRQWRRLGTAAHQSVPASNEAFSECLLLIHDRYLQRVSPRYERRTVPDYPCQSAGVRQSDLSASPSPDDQGRAPLADRSPRQWRRADLRLFVGSGAHRRANASRKFGRLCPIGDHVFHGIARRVKAMDTTVRFQTADIAICALEGELGHGLIAYHAPSPPTITRPRAFSRPASRITRRRPMVLDLGTPQTSLEAFRVLPALQPRRDISRCDYVLAMEVKILSAMSAMSAGYRVASLRGLTDAMSNSRAGHRARSSLSME